MSTRVRKIVRRSSITLIVLCVAILDGPYLGCRATPTQLPATNPTAGTLVHVVGWSGPGSMDRKLLYALRDGGCPMAMETFDWTNGRRGLIALWYSQHSDTPARALADHLQTLWHAQPGRPISLTADSSGCGVALAAVASLPPDVRVQTIVLSSPAVSPTYDLRPALAHVDRRLVSFNSDRDFWILCLGTHLVCTVDGQRVSAAGRVGFDLSSLDADQRSKVAQIPYDPAWASQYGNDGGHSKALGETFARSQIAPLLRTR